MPVTYPEFIRRGDFDELQYQLALDAGIAAVKGGDLQQAVNLLHKAAEMHPDDSRPWLWLSATSDDAAIQREFLEKAVAAEPGNAAARRGLALLNGKLERARLMPEGAVLPLRQSATPAEAAPAQTFLCPQCGGRMRFDPAQDGLACAYCDHLQPVATAPAADAAEQPLDFVLPTSRGHDWAQARHRLNCARCGAELLLPVGQKGETCPYCASNQLIASAETEDLVEPQAIALAQVDAAAAARAVGKWLGSGWFAPDDLRGLSRPQALRIAYYPFWTFDGTVAMHWSCEVNEGTSRYPYWVSRAGEEWENFDDVLVSGWKALPAGDLKRILPFHLQEVIAFDPAHLAGWAALAYDRPLTEASLMARDLVAKRLRSQLAGRVEIGSDKRNLQPGGVEWTALTFKHLLLPVWVGGYHYRGKDYRLLVNGQTGKVGGEKPLDPVKVGLAALSAGLILFLLAWLIAGLL